MPIVVKLGILLYLGVMVLLLNMFFFYFCIYQRFPRKYVCEQVAKKFKERNWEQPDSFAFKRKLNRTLDDYEIVMDYATRSKDTNFELLDQVADRVFRIATYNL